MQTPEEKRRKAEKAAHKAQTRTKDAEKAQRKAQAKEEELKALVSESAGKDISEVAN